MHHTTDTPDRSTLVIAMAALAAINALTWVLLVRAVGGALGVAVPTGWLAATAAVTGIAVPVAAGAVGLRRPSPHA